MVCCVDIAPTVQEVRAELKSNTIMKVEDTIALGKDFLKHKDAIAVKME